VNGNNRISTTSAHGRALKRAPQRATAEAALTAFQPQRLTVEH